MFQSYKKSQPSSFRGKSNEDATRKNDTSWQPVNKWYSKIVGTKGSYYHQHVVLPGVQRLLSLQSGDSLLDLGCGQGVLARSLPIGVSYCGVDASKSLVAEAKKLSPISSTFIVADATKSIRELKEESFSHAACVLALQNMQNPEGMFATVARVLRSGGSFVVVVNHPAFRIPRQSSWEVDNVKKTQYRRIDRYLSPLKIPIHAHPSERTSAVTWSFHWSLQDLIGFGIKSGFAVTAFEEWISDKESEGKAAKMENRSREEFPLFLAVRFGKHN